MNFDNKHFFIKLTQLDKTEWKLNFFYSAMKSDILKV